MLLSSHLIIERHDTLAIFVDHKRLQKTSLSSQQATEAGMCGKTVSVSEACTACQGKLQFLACQCTNNQCLTTFCNPSQLGYAAVKQYILTVSMSKTATSVVCVFPDVKLPSILYWHAWRGVSMGIQWYVIAWSCMGIQRYFIAWSCRCTSVCMDNEWTSYTCSACT